MVAIAAIWIIWWAVAFTNPKVIEIPSLPAMGMSIAPFILTSGRLTNGMMKHEMRHIWQQRLLSPPLMLLLYVLNFIVNLTWAWYPAIECKNWRLKWIRGYPFPMRWLWTAYSFIIFEMDAARFWWPSHK